MGELKNIIAEIKKTYNENAWHGPSTMDVINSVKAEECNKRVGDSHSIIELVLHMAAWRNFTTRRISGDDAFDVSDENNFPKGDTWPKAVAVLNQSQADLLKALENFDEQKLNEFVPTRKYTFYTLLHGITQHDIYHSGQIVMIKKS